MSPLTWSTLRRSSARLLLLGLLTSPSCNDRMPVDDDCFSLDPWKDERDAAAEYAMSSEFRPEEHDRMIRAIGFCEYDPEEIDEIFPDYDRTEVDTWSACISTATCEQCVGEDIDQRIRQAYDELLDVRGCPSDRRAIMAYQRGCVSAELDANDESVCCYSAAIISECPPGSVPGR